MRISECMTRKVQVASPDQSLRDAARVMADLDAGVLPVGENERLVGMITDRDIAVRGIAEGRGPDTKIRDARRYNAALTTRKSAMFFRICANSKCGECR